MERTKQKSKKDKSHKNADRDNSSVFITDVKLIKENLKIKEILRTVKMNSSMRIKAPPGSKVMNSKDFNDSDDRVNEDLQTDGSNQKLSEPSPSATNYDVVAVENENSDIKTGAVVSNIGLELQNDEFMSYEQIDNPPSDFTETVTTTEESIVTENNYADESSTDVDNTAEIQPPGTALLAPDVKFLIENTDFKSRERKLSLDHTILTRREGLSQSELDLNSIGKSPLERKSSFFRKKMESFFKNTTEIFKMQSISSKSKPVQRRGSMSVSLQSLNEKSGDYTSNTMFNNNQHMGSTCSLQSSSTMGRSTSSLATSHAAATSETSSLAGSQPLLSASQPLGDLTSDTVNSYGREPLLNTRAISMSSGLDAAPATRRRKSSFSRSNRVTWLANEGLSHYLRRLIQDEKSKEMPVCHSYMDFTTILENELCGERAPRLDSKGRRLSYQRAVSGEDPVLPPPCDSSLWRRRNIPEHLEANYDINHLLNAFSRNGVPPLKGFTIANIPEDAFAFLVWAEQPQNLEEFYDLKKLPAGEESRQAVIRELISTEAVHIKHLKSIVDVFIAAAHALQDAGKLLDVDTERLFSNIPDVLNASLTFWEITMYPMIADAVQNCTVFNTELMSTGFLRFRDIFAPYEKFVNEQTKALDYLRSLSNNTDFMVYLSWCHSHKECNRLQLADILVKPMQRLTKYSLILRRIIQYTETEPERTSLIAMESFSKNYVLDLNRSIRKREELEKLETLASCIENYEIDFKDEDMDRYFRMFSQLNLKAPMMNCVPTYSRNVIFQGDLRFKDKDKEAEVRAFLLTDMLLITKKQGKGSAYSYKMIRPKYMVDKLIHFSKPHPRNPKELTALIFVVIDEVGSAYTAFTLSESQKEKDASMYTLKTWEQKLREARLTYDMGVLFARSPSHDLSEMEMDSSSEYAASSGRQHSMKHGSDEVNIEREARERVAAMCHRSMGASTECDCSQLSMYTDSFDAAAGDGSNGMRTPGRANLRHPMYRTSTGGSSRQSRLSSFHHSTSAASHEHEELSGPCRGNVYRAGSSVEHFIPTLNPDENTVTSITVNVVGESESDTVVPHQKVQSGPPSAAQGGRLGSRSPGSGNTLRVHPLGGVLALVHSLPDLTVEPSPLPPRPILSSNLQSASEKLYQSHQELLQRNRLTAHQQHYLSPDHRGISYPPPSPTRASLKRGLAVSYSFKNPPLAKMGHVNSQSQVQQEHAGPSTTHQTKVDRSITPPPPVRRSTSSSEKGESKSNSRYKNESSGTAGPNAVESAGPCSAGGTVGGARSGDAASTSGPGASTSTGKDSKSSTRSKDKTRKGKEPRPQE